MTCGPYNIDPNDYSPSLTDGDGGDLRCPKDWQVIKLDMGIPNIYSIQISDPRLAELVDENEEIPETERVRLVFRSHYRTRDGKVVNGKRTGPNSFEFQFDSGHLRQPGLFIGEIIIFDESDGGSLSGVDSEEVISSATTPDDVAMRPVWVHRVYVEIEPSVRWATKTKYPLSIAEVRLALRDECAESNFLLDDLEYTNKEIVHCLHRVVDYWNEIPPPVATYNYSNFPFRHHWLMGTMGLLLQTVSVHKLRNWLPFSAGGLSIQDQQNWNHYADLGRSYWEEYKEWVIRKKIEFSYGGAYGGFRGRTTR